MGKATDKVEIGRLEGLSRPRVIQIMNLLKLAPDIFGKRFSHLTIVYNTLPKMNNITTAVLTKGHIL